MVYAILKYVFFRIFCRFFNIFCVCHIEIQMFYFFFTPFVFSIIGVRISLDIGGHIVRTLLCHCASVEKPSLANIEPCIQTHWTDLVRRIIVHVANSRIQQAHTDESRCDHSTLHFHFDKQQNIHYFYRYFMWNFIHDIYSVFGILGHHKCRDEWPANAKEYERAYNLFLDGILLVIPLIMLAATYSLITRSLWQGMRAEHSLKNHLSFDSGQSCKYGDTSNFTCQWPHSVWCSHEDGKRGATGYESLLELPVSSVCFPFHRMYRENWGYVFHGNFLPLLSPRNDSRSCRTVQPMLSIQSGLECRKYLWQQNRNSLCLRRNNMPQLEIFFVKI